MSVWKLSPNECRTLDLSNPDELLRYAKKLIGHSFREVLMLGISPDDSSMKDYGNVKFKGGMGTLIEERYFGYKANSDEHPDFPDAGVELKATCYDVKKTENCLLESGFPSLIYITMNALRPTLKILAFGTKHPLYFSSTTNATVPSKSLTKKSSM